MATLPSTSIILDQASLDRLQARVRGRVLGPADAGYDEAHRTWNVTVQQHPAVIVLAESATDVAQAVRFAAEMGLGVAIQSTGHGVVRPADNSLLVITSRMQGVRIDAEAQTAWVEAGVKWGAVLEKTQEVGLAPLLGSSPDVGVIGYTLAGGFGWLVRKYGLAIDSVLAFEVVTADGRVRRVSATENSDLFWALRGGGGSFAVVTGMEIELYPVTTVFGGNIIYPAAHAKEVMTRYRDWIATAPEELTSSIVLMNVPPLPNMPEFLRGQSVVMVRGLYSGPIEQAEEIFRVWQDGPEPLANLMHPMPFSEVASVSNDPRDPMPSFHTGGWLNALDDATIDTLIRFGLSVNGSSPLVLTEVRHVGGAMARADRNSTAFGHRDDSLLLAMLAAAPSPEVYQLLHQYTEEFKRELAPQLADHLYLNFAEGAEARARTRDGYPPEAFERLVALKAQYDPDNLFQYAFNFPTVDRAG
ncbi:MAG: FAD-binding oxidoreductase [Chloroflexi bacterium]|nr:FAD-binding oxidoreductase [Chloroflexota bacterium]